MGSPDGGWYDDDPPRILGCSPEDKATNVTSKKITIYFDEFVKLADDPVSPYYPPLADPLSVSCNTRSPP